MYKALKLLTVTLILCSNTWAEKKVLHESYLRLVSEKSKDAPFAWEYVERTKGIGDGVGIVAHTKNNEIVLVEQYRIPQHKRVLELPAGLIGDVKINEDVLSAAQKELKEETGFEVDKKDLKLLNYSPTSAGLTSERAYLVLAKNIERRGSVALDNGETFAKLKTHIIPLAKIKEFLESRRKDGVLIDNRVYSALYFLNSRY